MRLLALCYPTYNGALHTNSTDEYLVIAVDEILSGLMKLGWDIDAVSLCDPRGLPLMRSGLLPMRPDDVDPNSYDLIYHAFRDPTQPEVIRMLREADLLDVGIPTLNHAWNLLGHYKANYMPVLHRHGIGPELLSELPKDVRWGETVHGAARSQDGRFMRSWGINNNRGNYPQRRPFEIAHTRFLDNAAGGIRSFFRCGYALGRMVRGWLYASSDEMDIQKSGMCKHRVPYQLPAEYQDRLEAAMHEIGVDLAHIEGCFVDGQLQVFDINPYPTTYGASLVVTTNDMVNRIREGAWQEHIAPRRQWDDDFVTTMLSREAEPDHPPIAPRPSQPQAPAVVSVPDSDDICPQCNKPIPLCIDRPEDLDEVMRRIEPSFKAAPPMMTLEEAAYIQWFIEKLKPQSLLEYGAGASTAFFAGLVPQWTSIEHNPEWAERMLEQCPKIEMICKSGTPAEEYVLPEELNGDRFDIVFIDGAYRYQCIDALRDLLNPGGIAIVHDTRRPGYWGRKGPMEYMYHLTKGEINSHNDPHQGLVLLTDTERKEWSEWLSTIHGE